jgi:hypothetical protein
MQKELWLKIEWMASAEELDTEECGLNVLLLEF